MPSSRLCVLSGLVLFSCLVATAQTAKPAPISCSIRHTPASPGDLAASKGKWIDAIAAYAVESNSPGNEGDRAHNARIRAQLSSLHMEEASKDAAAWLSQAPTNAWALDASADVEFRMGNLDKAGEAFRTAATQNFCNAQVHADYARYLGSVGYNASAKSQLEIAHKLDPIDELISNSWLNYQPRETRVAALDTYVKNNPSLAEDELKHIKDYRSELASAPSAPCRLASRAKSVTIPFHAIRNGNASGGQQSNVEWGLEIGLNGKKRRLQIDSGAHGILLTRAAAESLGLEIKSESHVYGLANDGGVDSSISHVKSIVIGGIEYQDCDVEIMKNDVMISQWDADRSEMEGQDGLIGTDVFQNFLVTLDFPGKLMKLDPLPVPPNATTTSQDSSIQTGAGGSSEVSLHDRYIDPSMTSWTKFTRIDHYILIPVRVNNGPIHLFLVDTGAFTELISPAAAKEVGQLGHGSGDTMFGVTGEVKGTHNTGGITLDFAGLRQPVNTMTAIDLNHLNDVVEISGLLGQYTLHQLTMQIDYRDQLIHFTFDPNRIAHCMTNVTLDDCY